MSELFICLFSIYVLFANGKSFYEKGRFLESPRKKTDISSDQFHFLMKTVILENGF